MNTFISCDWGTTAFRLRWVNTETKQVLASVKSELGIAAVYRNWLATTPAADRVSYYRNILQKEIANVEAVCNQSLENITVVISGMASSSIGMIELPYKELPFSLDGSDVITYNIASSPQFQYNLLFISGAKTNNDVMRGEETKLLGCNIDDEGGTQLIIMPGTHAKHIEIKDGKAIGFNTYMTGELFDLLSTKSVLAASIEKHAEANEDVDSFFVKGVQEGAQNNFLNSIFHVRTARLFSQHTPKQNYHYLSGMLIGGELQGIPKSGYSKIHLLASGILAQRYAQALHALGVYNVCEQDADEALLAGQTEVFLKQKRDKT